jgi:hypothetical protein
MTTNCDGFFWKNTAVSGFPLRATLRSGLRAAVLFCGLHFCHGSASAQEMANPSLENPVIPSGGKPFIMAPSLELEDSGWTWGAFTGICRQDAGFAKGLYAHEGSQMAFLRGDPRKSKIKRKGPQHMCVGYITGLKPGENYELQWAEAGRASDVEFGALTVVLRETEGSEEAVYLQRKEPVTSKGEWAEKTLTFTAASPNMNVVFLHSVPDFGKSNATGDEITFLDDLRIVPVTKKVGQ